MMHLGKRAGLSALLAALIFAAPLMAADPEKSNVDLAKEIRDLRKDVADLAKAVRLGGEAIKADMTALEDRLTKVERAVRRNTADIRDLRSSPETRGTLSVDPIVPVATGTVRLENRLGVPATVTLNGVAYSVPALRTATVARIPAGPITYEANAPGMGEGVPVRSRLSANETLTVTIFDPASRP
jgi:hypothetical protein